MNIHTPERFPDESQREYRARQSQSRAIAKQMKTFIGFAPGVGRYRIKPVRDMGQHPKFVKPRRRKPQGRVVIGARHRLRIPR